MDILGRISNRLICVSSLDILLVFAFADSYLDVHLMYFSLIIIRFHFKPALSFQTKSSYFNLF